MSGIIWSLLCVLYISRFINTKLIMCLCVSKTPDTHYVTCYWRTSRMLAVYSLLSRQDEDSARVVDVDEVGDEDLR